MTERVMEAQTQDNDGRPTILFVDDHPSIRLILSAGLKAHGFDVLTCRDHTHPFNELMYIPAIDQNVSVRDERPRIRVSLQPDICLGVVSPTRMGR